jgi:putative ABC transport system permease protein
MTAVALRGLAGRKLRALLTALAIVLGVALIAGSYVLTDSIDRAFHSIFTSSYASTDAVVSGKKIVDWSSSGNATVPASLLPRVKELPGVEAAAGNIVDFNGDEDTAKLIDKHGKTIDGSGNPTFGFGIDGSQPRFSPLKLTEGAWASGPHQVVIDAATAKKYGFHVGDPVRISVDGISSYRVSGIAGFGDVSSLGGATIAVFDVPTAQRLLHKTNAFDTIAVAARDGFSQAKLLDELRSILPAHTQVRTGAAQAQEDEQGVATFVNVIRYFLLAFGAIALFVGSFVIFNTLSITVAQRSRELATLRTLGATRRQVLRSVVLEAFVLGLVASAIGLGLGVGLAHGLKKLFASLGLDLPTGALSLEPRTIVVSLLAGVVLTVLAGLVPAVRATRVPPIAAVREGAGATRKQGRAASIVGLVLTIVAGSALAAGLFAHGLDSGQRLVALLLGALGLFLGIALVAPRLVKPVVAIVGRPSRRLGGAAGRLAVENAQRNPGRTAATAAALMIGLALVTFVTAFGKGLQGSDVNSLKDQVRSDYVVTSKNGWANFAAGASTALSHAPGVTLASPVRFDRARVNGANASVNAVDLASARSQLGLEWKQGSASTLTGAQALVKESFAEDNHLVPGDRLRVVTPNGHQLALRVKAIFKTPKLDSVLGGVVIAQSTFDRSFPRPRNALVLVDVRGGASAGAERSLAAALRGYPDTKLDTRDGWASTRAHGFTQILNLFYVLLALSVVVSLFGMVNTLALSVFERTRELGMLRAVGMTRRQARRMVRHEGIVTALIGAAMGIPLGIGLAAAAATALSKFGVAFTVPPTVIVFVLTALSAGTLAAILPARRASKLDVLRALQYE